MDSFQYIVEKIINKEKNGKFEPKDINFFSLCSYYINTKDIYNLNSKYDLFFNFITNLFISNENKERYIELFSKIQKIYFSFIKFKNQYKYKKCKILIETDLLLNPLSKDNKHCLQIIQNKYKYLFSLNDIINLFQNALTKSCNLFLDLSPIKNPYNNLVFNKSTLYNMYFFIKEKTISNIELIDKYFICNFDLNKYKDEYKHLIRDYTIKIHIKNSSDDTFKELFDEMMLDFYHFNKKVKKIYVHDEFPISELRKIMKDYIYLHLTSKYSLIEYKKIRARNTLQNKLIKFHNYNPLFGRKYIKLLKYYCNKSFKLKKELEINFNKKHIAFNDTSNIWLTKKNNIIYSTIDNFDTERYVDSANEEDEIDNNELNRELYIIINEIEQTDNNNITGIHNNLNFETENNETENDDTVYESYSSDEESIYENPLDDISISIQNDEEYNELDDEDNEVDEEDDEDNEVDEEDNNMFIDCENNSDSDSENENENEVNPNDIIYFPLNMNGR